MAHRVVVTGVGAVTPLGGDVASSWDALISGRDAAAPLDRFDVTGCRCRQAASARLPDLPGLPAKSTSRLSRASRLAIPAVREALDSARLLDAHGKSSLADLPISVSTTAGGMAFGEDFLRSAVARDRAHLLSRVSRYLPQQQVLDVQKFFGFAGHAFIVANACASGANAIGHAADMIAAGAADCVLTGGFEALSELVFVGFDCLQASTTERCRPFDQTRSGLILGEAAAFLVLESEDHARRRGVAPLCALSGYGHTTDFFHLTQPQPDGAALVEVMRAASRQAGVEPAQVGYINAHGTATIVNDGVEAKAYRTFLGDDFSRARISSTKAAIGHTLGAAGAVEALFAIEALLSRQLPPQLNSQKPLPEMAAALVGSKESAQDLDHVMSVNLGFGGSNAALIFSRERAA